MSNLEVVLEVLTTAQAVLVRYNPGSGTAVQCKDAALALQAHKKEVAALVEALEQIMSLPMYIDENGWATVHVYPGLLREARAILNKMKP